MTSRIAQASCDRSEMAMANYKRFGAELCIELSSWWPVVGRNPAGGAGSQAQRRAVAERRATSNLRDETKKLRRLDRPGPIRSSIRQQPELVDAECSKSLNINSTRSSVACPSGGQEAQDDLDLGRGEASLIARASSTAATPNGVGPIRENERGRDQVRRNCQFAKFCGMDTLRQPWLVLHELAHGSISPRFHQQRYRNPEIIAAFRRAAGSKRYDSVLLPMALKEKAYAHDECDGVFRRVDGGLSLGPTISTRSSGLSSRSTTRRC